MYALTNGWNSHFATLDELRRYMHGFRTFTDAPSRRRAAVGDRGDAYVLEADVPGATPESIKLDVTAKGFTLSIETTVARPSGLEARRLERASEKLSERVELPAAIDPDKVTATLLNGALTIVFPKASEQPPRRIAVSG